MCTLARPVRVAARLAWKVATAPSMRRRRSALSSLSAGIPAMMESAIGFVLVVQLTNGYSTKTEGVVEFEHGNNHYYPRSAGHPGGGNWPAHRSLRRAVAGQDCGRFPGPEPES